MPNLVGEILQNVRWQGFVVNGELIRGAGVLYLRVSDVWYRLAIDAGTVHWYREDREPKTWSVPEQSWEYPVSEVKGAWLVTDQRVLSISISDKAEQVQIEIMVDNGHKLVMSGHGEGNTVHAV